MSKEQSHSDQYNQGCLDAISSKLKQLELDRQRIMLFQKNNECMPAWVRGFKIHTQISGLFPFNIKMLDCTL